MKERKRNLKSNPSSILSPKIIFEDDEFFVIDKPAHWIVNSSDTTTNQPVLQDWLGKLNYPLSNNLELRAGIVHRLDKETSGCLIVAKTAASMENLQAQFKERTIQKKYLALAHGFFKEQKGEIVVSVGRLPWRRDRFGIIPNGRDSQTFYEVIGKYSGKDGEYSLVILTPKTGRTHQIRIHLKFLGHPIVADHFYAGRKRSRKDRLWCERLFLHASEVIFSHPKTGKKIEIKSELPYDLQNSLMTLTKV